MKKSFSSLAKVFLALLLCCGMLFSLMPAQNASAAKMTNKKAQKILKKKIKNKFCKYAFIDLDKDKIDEMIVLGFSGKFVDGDDAKKTLDVYKVSGTKAKSILSRSIEGDFYHPSLSFNLYYYNKTSYLTVNDCHEGYCDYTTYKFTGKKFEVVASVDDWASEGEQFYYIGGEVSKEEYDKFMKNILANEVNVELKSCTTKVTNKYLRKMMKAEFDYRCSHELYDKNAKTEYKDMDDNGIDELVVWKDSTHVDVFYAINPDGTEYYTDITPYKVVNGEFYYDGDDYRSMDEIAALAGIWYAGGKLDALNIFDVDETGLLTEYTRTVGDPEPSMGRTCQILFAAGSSNGFYIAPLEDDSLQTYFIFSPESENGKGDRMIFDDGAYFYQKME